MRSKILKSKCQTAQLILDFRASLVNYYMHKHVNIVLWWNPKGWWEKTELSIGTLADLGAMPIDYEPIDWNKYLEPGLRGKG